MINHAPVDDDEDDNADDEIALQQHEVSKLVDLVNTWFFS